MKVTIAAAKKVKPDFTKLGFGKYFTDHMLVMDYKDGQWQEPEIVPYSPFELSPATSVLHYAQGIFEGAKAYKTKEGKVTVFRIEENFKRMNKSAERLSMPQFDEEAAKAGLFELIKIDSDWIPTEQDTSLYIRPTMIATDDMLGVHAAKSYRFFIILSPVGAYYANGFMPTKIKVEDVYARSIAGGTGEAKCMGNYAMSLLAAEEAAKQGFDQVLWLDGAERKYIEEVGSMNIFFVIDGEVVTPALTGTLLAGITRMSCIELLKKYGYKVAERKMTIDEVLEAQKNGKLEECFGTGTAAVVSPVGVINYKGQNLTVADGNTGKVTNFLYDMLTGIQYGRYADEFGWIQEVK